MERSLVNTQAKSTEFNSIIKPPFTPLVIILVFGAFLVGCGDSGASPAALLPTPESAYRVEPMFREYYAFLGGAEVMGHAITPKVVEGTIEAQYFIGGKIVYDPNAPLGQNIHLAPLGIELGLGDTNAQGPGNFKVHPMFAQLYHDLGGERVVGAPISDLQIDQPKGRSEQHFENIGFYKSEEQTGEVRLLSYGLAACEPQCRTDIAVDPPSIIELHDRPEIINEPFASAISRLGSQFLGDPLFGPNHTSDDKTIVIFENFVLYTPNDDRSSRVFALPIVQELGIVPEPPTDNYHDPRMIFYQIDGDKGFNIPRVFSDYFAQHGGLDILGIPMTEVHEIYPGEYRQCFMNGCLGYHTNAIEEFKVRPVPLGVQYFWMKYPNEAADFYNGEDERSFSPPDPATIRLVVWEASPHISPHEPQRISVNLFEGSNAIAGWTPELLIIHPDGRQESWLFPATGSNGRAERQIPPIPAPNGTVIQYRVCLSNIASTPVCVDDGYLIWGP